MSNYYHSTDNVRTMQLWQIYAEINDYEREGVHTLPVSQVYRYHQLIAERDSQLVDNDHFVVPDSPVDYYPNDNYYQSLWLSSDGYSSPSITTIPDSNVQMDHDYTVEDNENYDPVSQLHQDQMSFIFRNGKPLSDITNVLY